jgi:enoyl-CoA hydratase/carnithine racemase
MAPPVLVQERDIGRGLVLGHITLNAEATLNSLSLEMIDLIQGALDRWRSQTNMIAIFFDAAGSKAFSAGGDIQNLYHDMQATPGGPCTYCDAFFEREYRLDYDLHQYPKPTLAWGHGIVMGGGLGIFSACTFRIATEKTRMAMPEITIGLFPDAGATYTFSRMDPVWSHFLALTGAQISGADAQHVGMADALIHHDRKDDCLAALGSLDNSQPLPPQISAILVRLQAASTDLPEPQLPNYDGVIRPSIEAALLNGNPIKTLAAAIQGWPDSAFLNRAKSGFLNGSAITAAIVIEQFKRAQSQDMLAMFQMELNLAGACSRHGEFAEGVRALLIEKDGKPNWRFQLGDVPDAVVQSHFEEHWPEHPLADLCV